MLLNNDFFGDFQQFSSQTYHLKMRRSQKSDTIFLKQQFHVDFENLIGFEVGPKKRRKTDRFLQNSIN